MTLDVRKPADTWVQVFGKSLGLALVAGGQDLSLSLASVLTPAPPQPFYSVAGPGDSVVLICIFWMPVRLPGTPQPPWCRVTAHLLFCPLGAVFIANTCSGLGLAIFLHGVRREERFVSFWTWCCYCPLLPQDHSVCCSLLVLHVISMEASHPDQPTLSSRAKPGEQQVLRNCLFRVARDAGSGHRAGI